ncbi:hypothetical protein AwDysgo_21440 [Bacteroidales bacterium]|nr:hypothetical protein AwDysgo_21440 [Bacteroidales bacterium]
MDKKTQDGYKQVSQKQETKRYCQYLELKNEPALIAEYVKRHSEAYAWPEVKEGIKSVGILEMELYIIGNRLFMIVETALDFQWDEAFSKLAKLPRQEEWEEYVSIFQVSKSGASSAEKWTLMDRIFHL